MESRADHLNLVSSDGKGQLCLDVVGLMGVLHGSVKRLMVVDKQRQVEVQLLITTVGKLDMRLDHLSKQFDQFKATTTFNSPDDREVLATTCMGASEEDARPGKCCSMQSANALQGILSDAEDLEDEVDVDMAEGAKAGPGECSSGSEVYSSPSAFQGLSDDEVAEELAQSLGEIETNVIHMFKNKFLRAIKKDVLRTLLDEALQETSQIASGNSMRSPGGYFINRAKAYLSQQRIAEGTDKGESHCTDKLRQYQQKILERAKSGDNLIIVAPTGSGKTAIAIHRSAEVLRGDDERRIVFLAPTVALAEQQACAYQSTAPFRHGAFKVECRCGENPVAPKQWSTVLRSCHVLVMTPQTLLNMLDSGNAHIDQISLLILDECHHARDNHSFAKVLVHYRKSSQQTQLLGFTACPVSKRSMVSTYNGLQVLMDNMRADFVILDANNLELKEVVNKANERAPILIQPRQEDIHFGKKLGAFIIWAISITGPLIPVPEPTCSTTTSFQKESSAVLPHEVAKMLQEGRWCSTAAIWCKKAAEKLLQSSMSSHINDLICCLRLVRVAVTTLALVGDIGYEVAVRHLSREYAGIAVEVVGSVEKLNDVLYCRNNEEFAFNNSYQRTLQLIQHLVEETIDVHTLKEAYKCAFQFSTEHPKFKALCNVLKDKVQMKDFHGIVFARTREAVRSLVQLMKALPDFQEVEVFAFMGHGGQKRDTSIKGMRVKEQQQVMSQFKTPGRKLLIQLRLGRRALMSPAVSLWYATLLHRQAES